MTEINDEQIGQALRDLTEWEDESHEGLWEKALDDLGPNIASSRVDHLALLHTPITLRQVGIAAGIVLFIAVGVVIATLPEIGSSRESIDLSISRGQRNFDGATSTVHPESNGAPWTAGGNGHDELTGGMLLSGGGGGGFNSDDGRRVAPLPTRPSSELQNADSHALEREIVRKATMHLLTNDVRAAYVQASHLISAARGEFVEESSLTGQDAYLQGQLVLRVEASRLDEILGALRELGRIEGEQIDGDDVTVQIVDLDARMRNEQRVESELLDLMERRNDAPLKEILELRNELSRIRQSIERLDAQREQLGHLVRLATVMVFIRPANEEPVNEEIEEGGIGEVFLESLNSAWNDGLQFLAVTVGFIVRIVTGGIIWWTIGIGGLIAYRSVKRREALVKNVPEH